jgi:hypothetical protein
MCFLAPKWAQQQGYSAFTRKRVISFFWFLAWSYIIVKGNWWQIPFFLENFQFWDFAYWRPSICEKMRFLIIPWPTEGWHWLKLALNDVFITMTGLLTCFECICSFLLNLCANKRLNICSIQAWAWPGMHRQEKKVRKKFFFIDSKWSNS